MDPTTLATMVLSAVAPLAGKSAEALAKELGKKAADLASGLLQALRARWAPRPEEMSALNDFLAEPSQKRETLSMKLAVQLATDQNLRVALEKILRGDGPQVIISQLTEDTERSIGAKVDEMRTGELQVDQEVRRGKTALGADIKKLG